MSRMKKQDIIDQLNAQMWRCPFAKCRKRPSGKIREGDELASCEMNEGTLSHLICVLVGQAPEAPSEKELRGRQYRE